MNGSFNRSDSSGPRRSGPSRGGPRRPGSFQRRDGGSFQRRDRDGGSFHRPGNFQKREMHKATCDQCKQECEVPFKPTQGKPVYCKDCYKKRQGF